MNRRHVLYCQLVSFHPVSYFVIGYISKKNVSNHFLRKHRIRVAEPRRSPLSTSHKLLCVCVYL